MPIELQRLPPGGRLHFTERAELGMPEISVVALLLLGTDEDSSKGSVFLLHALVTAESVTRMGFCQYR